MSMNDLTINPRSAPLLLALALGLGACGSDETTEEDIDVEACTLIQAAPVAITASTDRASARAITPGETAYAVKTSTAANTYLSIEVDEGLDAVFFLDTDGVATGKYFFEGAERTLAAGTANENCAAEIPDHYHLELDEVGTYHLELGPSVVDVVIVVHPDSGPHDH